MRGAGWLAMAVTMWTAGGCGSRPAATLDGAEIARVEETLESYRQAWLRNDEPGVMSLISGEFAMFVPGTGTPRVDGLDQLRSFWFPKAGNTFRITRYDVTGQKVSGSGTLAVVEGQSTLAWDTMAGDSVASSSSSKSDFLTVLRKEAGGWRFYRQMYLPR